MTNTKKTAKTYTATMPNGETVSRNSVRPFTHVLLMNDEKGWGYYSWHGTREAAMKKRDSLISTFAKNDPDNGVEFRIAEVRES